MAARMFQNMVFKIRDIIEDDFGICDANGTIIASTTNNEIGQTLDEALDIINSNEELKITNGITLKKILTHGRSTYIAFIRSDKSDNRVKLNLISISIENIKLYYDEKFDKDSFIKNVLLGNILPGDISIKSKELRVKYEVFRVAYLIKNEKTRELNAYNVIKSLFPEKNRDFVVLIDDEHTVLIKELKDQDRKDIYKKAQVIIDTLNTELMIKASVGIGSIVSNLKDISKSYNEAQTAMQIGSIFESEKAIIDYNRLGIGRLIYQLPTTLCRLFLSEVFKEGVFESIDSETMMTIQKFFENNLNVSETSRQLFIHRNTLVYRLDKIQKLTGMDLRKFDDAIYFKVAMMVKRYLDEFNP